MCTNFWPCSLVHFFLLLLLSSHIGGLALQIGMLCINGVPRLIRNSPWVKFQTTSHFHSSVVRARAKNATIRQPSVSKAASVNHWCEPPLTAPMPKHCLYWVISDEVRGREERVRPQRAGGGQTSHWTTEKCFDFITLLSPSASLKSVFILKGKEIHIYCISITAT